MYGKCYTNEFQIEAVKQVDLGYPVDDVVHHLPSQCIRRAC